MSYYKRHGLEEPMTIESENWVITKNPKGHQEDEPEWFYDEKDPWDNEEVN